MRILVDMDGVLADFEQGFLTQWRARYPHERFIPLDQRYNRGEVGKRRLTWTHWKPVILGTSPLEGESIREARDVTSAGS